MVERYLFSLYAFDISVTATDSVEVFVGGVPGVSFAGGVGVTVVGGVRFPV